MKPLLNFIEAGGPVMPAILLLSVILYSRCGKLALALRRVRCQLDATQSWPADELPRLRQMRDDLWESFRRQRIALAAMVAAAPLLGLLGTVSGMVKTFENLAQRANGQSMGDLANGISQVLVATESGLAVAIPALVIIHWIHSRVRRNVERLNEIETQVRLEGAR